MQIFSLRPSPGLAERAGLYQTTQGGITAPGPTDARRRPGASAERWQWTPRQGVPVPGGEVRRASHQP